MSSAEHSAALPVNQPLDELAKALDPTREVVPALVPQDRVRPGQLAFTPFPHAGNPRLLLPAGQPRAAAAALRRRTEGTGWPRSGVSDLLARLVTLGALDRTPLRRMVVGAPGVAVRDVPLLARLAEVVEPELTVAVRTPAQRPNGKPVLMLLTPAGRVLGYAKIGTNALTRALVRHEAEVLAGFTEEQRSKLSFEVPRVLHHENFHDVEVLVVSCLPGGRPASRTAERRALREIAALAGPQSHQLAESDFWCRMEARIASLPADDAAVAAIAATTDTVRARLGEEQLLFGGWHGDWTPWNMVATGDRLAVWDWERSLGTAPVGLDAVHGLILVTNHRGRLDQRRIRRLARRAEGVVSDLGQPSRHASLIVVLGLLEMAIRFEEARSMGMRVINRYPTLLAPALTVLDEPAYSGRSSDPATRRRAS